tara:strand:+ start:1534 stop:1932 length:399 start_codon:yes stop_codon:yes gene_type:complete
MKKIIIILALFMLTAGCSKLNFFGFGEKRNQFEKLKINESLWIASKNLLSKYEAVETNLKEGNISSGWIISDPPTVRFRISIYILGSDLYEENLKIFTEKQLNINGVWKKRQVSESFNAKLKKKIINDAKSL